MTNQTISTRDMPKKGLIAMIGWQIAKNLWKFLIALFGMGLIACMILSLLLFNVTPYKDKDGKIRHMIHKRGMRIEALQKLIGQDRGRRRYRGRGRYKRGAK